MKTRVNTSPDAAARTPWWAYENEKYVAYSCNMNKYALLQNKLVVYNVEFGEKYILILLTY